MPALAREFAACIPTTSRSEHSCSMAVARWCILLWRIFGRVCAHLQGGFIHPDDLEPEEDYYEGEGEIMYPGVIRPFSEALEKAKEEARSEKVYDEDGFRYPARARGAPPAARCNAQNPAAGAQFKSPPRPRRLSRAM